MVKLRTGPFGPLVEEAFVKHGITQVTMAAQITEEKWKQARVPLQRALGCG
jgi:topoisomerase IA-like protein